MFSLLCYNIFRIENVFNIFRRILILPPILPLRNDALTRTEIHDYKQAMGQTEKVLGGAGGKKMKKQRRDKGDRDGKKQDGKDKKHVVEKVGTKGVSSAAGWANH